MLFIYFCFSFLCLGETDPKKYCHDSNQTVFCLCFLLGVLWFMVGGDKMVFKKFGQVKIIVPMKLKGLL